MKFSSKLLVTTVRISLLGVAPLFFFALVAGAQTFSSGSNGTDGPFDLTGTAAGSVVTFVPANYPGNQHNLNVFNFTTITIPSGVTVRLSSKNISGPVMWLASEDVDIEGTIDLSGQAGLPITPILDGRRRATDTGVGGYAGGVGGKTDGSTTSNGEPLAQPGDGPGGGSAAFSSNCGGVILSTVAGGGNFTGNSFLVPLVGGSGGGGGLIVGTLGSTPYGAGGGAGGGAILIASSTTVTINGTINANGGTGGNNGATITNLGCKGSWFASGMAGGGSGGGIRLAANMILPPPNVSHS